MTAAKRAPSNLFEERHSAATETVRYLTSGTSDGLTVPFALAVVLTGAITAYQIIITMADESDV